MMIEAAKPSAISRRMESFWDATSRQQLEESLIHLFPALDKTAKRRRPKAQVGDRIRGFLADQEGIMSTIATGNFMKDIYVDGVSIPDAIYRFGRCSIMHEGELDPRLRVTDGPNWSIGQVWVLPRSFVLGIAVAVMIAPENLRERLATDRPITFLGQRWRLNELWGAESALKRQIAQRFRDPSLFV
jgi:hypothetical protein